LLVRADGSAIAGTETASSTVTRIYAASGQLTQVVTSRPAVAGEITVETENQGTGIFAVTKVNEASLEPSRTDIYSDATKNLKLAEIITANGGVQRSVLTGDSAYAFDSRGDLYQRAQTPKGDVYAMLTGANSGSTLTVSGAVGAVEPAVLILASTPGAAVSTAGRRVRSIFFINREHLSVTISVSRARTPQSYTSSGQTPAHFVAARKAVSIAQIEGHGLILYSARVESCHFSLKGSAKAGLVVHWASGGGLCFRRSSESLIPSNHIRQSNPGPLGRKVLGVSSHQLPAVDSGACPNQCVG
jgi:hypothetical protein